MPLPKTGKAAEFAALPIETRREQVAEWVVSTLDEETVRRKLRLMFKVLYRQEPLAYAVQENAFLAVVKNYTGVKIHDMVELTQKE